MKLFKQKSSLLPNLKLKKITQCDESQKTTRLYYKPKIILIKEKENCENNNNVVNKEKNEIIYLRNEPDLKKRSASNKINYDKGLKNINELKEEIESLKSQLSDEKLKSEVLKEIAEDEQKKHLFYKKKFQTIVLSKGDLIDEMDNTKKTSSFNNKKNIYINNKMINSNSLKNAINNSNLDSSGINICLSSPRQQCFSPSQTIYANNINKSLSNKKYKYINLKKIKEELVELKQNNSEKEKIIINLESQITQLKNDNEELLNSKKVFENEINKLREEINLKNKENEKLSLKLNEEKKANKEYIDKLKEIKKIKEKYVIKLQYE